MENDITPTFTELLVIANGIINSYTTRQRRIADVAKDQNVSEYAVRKTLKAYDFHHTIQWTSENLKPGQVEKVIICYDDLKHLKKYVA